jgi:uncharacterized protein with ParB-like and HNH nuclease domain
MRPFSRSVIELFDGKKRYLIPLFQRQYVWRQELQLARIWDDVKLKVEQRMSNRRTLPHFLGAIVISQVATFGKQVQAYDVIDGQQRLSTFQILLCSFRDVAANLGSEFSAELQKYIVNDGVMEDKKVERYKLWPTQVDRGQLKALVDEGSSDNLAMREKAEFSQKKTGVNPNMIVAYRFFYDKINELLNDSTVDLPVEEKVEALFSSLKNDLALVAIELEGGDDPQVIFETLNGFGQPLLPTDLMRNYIFQTAYREDLVARDQAGVRGDGEKTPEELYGQYWLPLDQAFWKKEEKQGRIKRPRVDNFFMHFLAMKKATDINVGRLFHEYRHWVEATKPYANVEELLIDTARFASVYKDLAQPADGGRFAAFSQAQIAFDVTTIVPLILYLDDEAKLEGPDLAKCLEMLESFLVRRAVCGLTNKNYNRLFLQIIEQIRGAQDQAVALEGALLKAGEDVPTAFWPGDAAFSAAWESRAIYNGMSSSRIQFILTRVEAALRTAKNEDFVLKSVMTVEHIMPVSWGANWPLRDGRIVEDVLARLTDDSLNAEAILRDRAVHGFGNLTLLTRALNTSVSNGAWNVKRAQILTHSALAISRGLMDAEIWDEDSIAKRSKLLLATALTVWRHPKHPLQSVDPVPAANANAVVECD